MGMAGGNRTKGETMPKRRSLLGQMMVTSSMEIQAAQARLDAAREHAHQLRVEANHLAAAESVAKLEQKSEGLPRVLPPLADAPANTATKTAELGGRNRVLIKGDALTLEAKKDQRRESLIKLTRRLSNDHVTLAAGSGCNGSSADSPSAAPHDGEQIEEGSILPPGFGTRPPFYVELFQQAGPALGEEEASDEDTAEEV